MNSKTIEELVKLLVYKKWIKDQRLNQISLKKILKSEDIDFQKFYNFLIESNLVSSARGALSSWNTKERLQSVIPNFSKEMTTILPEVSEVINETPFSLQSPDVIPNETATIDKPNTVEDPSSLWDLDELSYSDILEVPTFNENTEDNSLSKESNVISSTTEDIIELDLPQVTHEEEIISDVDTDLWLFSDTSNKTEVEDKWLFLDDTIEENKVLSVSSEVEEIKSESTQVIDVAEEHNILDDELNIDSLSNQSEITREDILSDNEVNTDWDFSEQVPKTEEETEEILTEDDNTVAREINFEESNKVIKKELESSEEKLEDDSYNESTLEIEESNTDYLDNLQESDEPQIEKIEDETKKKFPSFSVLDYVLWGVLFWGWVIISYFFL